MKRFLFIPLLAFSLAAFGSATRTLDGQQITNNGAVITLPTTTMTMAGATALSGSNTGDITISGTAHGLSLSGQALSLAAATASVDGALLATDFITFAAKLTSTLTSGNIFVGNGSNVAASVALSGDATLSNSGALTIGAKKIQASKLDSGAAAANTVATADGSGGVSYLPVPSSAPALNGGSGSPQSVTASGGISLSGITYDNFVWVIGSPGAVTITKTPSITACTADGQKLHVIGTDATKTVRIQDKSNLASSGVSSNGDFVGALDSTINYHCDITRTLWVEDSRSN